ncbi:MAG: hypothetical protein ACK4N5_26180, partial [Myxococcales bacterium]
MSPTCSMCERAEPTSSRALVPDALLGDAGAFDFDPLGTAGASATLCDGCSALLGHGMVAGEDLEAFARTLRLYLKAHPAPDVRGEWGESLLGWQRRVSFGLRVLG